MRRIASQLSPETRIAAGLLLAGVCGVLILLAIDAGSSGRPGVGLWLGAFVLGYPGLLLAAWGLLALASPRVD